MRIFLYNDMKKTKNYKFIVKKGNIDLDIYI